MHRFHIIILQVISQGGFQQNVAFLCNIRRCDIPIIGLHWCIVSYTVAFQKIYYQEGYMGRITTANTVVGVYPISKEHCWKHARIGSFNYLRYCRILELSADISNKALDLFEQEKFVSAKFKMTPAMDSFDQNPSSTTRTGSYIMDIIISPFQHHFLDCYGTSRRIYQQWLMFHVSESALFAFSIHYSNACSSAFTTAWCAAMFICVGTVHG